MSLHGEYDSEETLALVPKKDKVKKRIDIVKILKVVFPFLTWAPNYTLNWLQCDIIAGITVGMTVIPQGLAYSQIANLPVQYGLYSAFMGGFIYSIFGTSKDVTLGPTAIMSLLVRTYGDGDPVQVVILTLLSGCIQFAMGVFHLGFIMWFLSVPVISGFTSAAAITIGFGQVKHILGVKTKSSDFIPEVIETFRNIPQTNIWDVVLGLSCIVLLLLLRFLSKSTPSNPDDTKLLKVSRAFLWYITIGRNAVIVICAALVALALHSQKITTCKVQDCLTLTGNITKGLPPFKAPVFTKTIGNETTGAGQFVENIGIGLAIVPLMGILESIAIGKAFARINGYNLRINQEMIAIGLANICSSFVSSYSITGSFSRTAINAQSGVKTPAAGIFTGTVVILGLALLTPYFYYIPKAALAAVIISAVVFMVDYKTVKKLWYTKKIDLIPLIVTFLVCFWEIPYGILAGIFVSVIILLFPAAVPGFKVDSISVTKDGENKEILMILLKSGLSFPTAEYTCNFIKETVAKADNPLSVVLDFQHVTLMDFSVAQALCETAIDLRKIDIDLFIVSATENVRVCLVNTCDEPGVLNFAADLSEAMPSD